MLIVWFLWYLLCYVPTPLITTYFLGFLKRNWPVFLWMKLLLTCGPAGTPFIFLSLNAEYRTAVRGLLLAAGRGTSIDVEAVATYRHTSMRSSTERRSRSHSASVTLTRPHVQTVLTIAH
ncbi:uncharacterized protein LOC129582477 [Paramacrobiotus metropolitanus]|uniref:uncharacterized protein LOC129582477 n=1 Tax=Paramacrobiotus metropolitanus TaxID=2943436 RepID=UPI002445C455|nr:uncharacterized protein LOC129582477 [Paramacrobiotus metropolitanus]